MKYIWLFVCFAVVRSQREVVNRRERSEFCPDEGFIVCGNSTKCISPKAVCDGSVDCANGWDEANCKCTRKKDCPRGVKCQKDANAGTSACVNCAKGQHFVKFQCEDVNECLNATICAGTGSCVNRVNGYECIACPQGYEASLRHPRLFSANPVDSESETFRKLLLCTDHNECAEDDPCSNGVCFNRVGGYACECPPNHEIRSGVQRDNICQAKGEQPIMAIGNDSSIVIFELRSAEPIKELKWSERIVDLSGDRGMVVFATRRQICEYRIETAVTTILADFENEEYFAKQEIKKISVDWENHRVYVLTGDSVSVIDIVGRAVRIIDHRGNISSIAVDPVAGYLFYSEAGHVHRTHLDGFGESAKTVFNALPADDPKSIDVLAVDPNLKYVYYIHNKVLYSFDYDGHRAMVIKEPADYTRLEPFEDLLYATYQVVISDSIVTLGRTGYSVGDPPGSRVKSFAGTLPKSFTIIQSAKFPTRPSEENTCRSRPCTTEWCFPMPLSRQPSYHCDCGASRQGNCLPLETYYLKPVENDIFANEVEASVAGASVPITAQTTLVGITIPIVLVFLISLSYFR